METTAADLCMCVPVTVRVCLVGACMNPWLLVRAVLNVWCISIHRQLFSYDSIFTPWCVCTYIWPSHFLSRRWQPSRGRCLIFWATNGLPSWQTSCTSWPSSWACSALCSFASDTSSLWVHLSPVYSISVFMRKLMSVSVWQYAAWLVLWVGWNSFIICFYLEVGNLSQVKSVCSGSHMCVMP